MPKKILAASPHQAFAELLRASLETGGQYSVNVVQSGEAASSAAAAQAYDLAIVDLELTDRPVEALIHDLRFKQPGLPLIFVPPENKLAPPEIASIPNHSILTRPFYLPDLLSKVESSIGLAHDPLLSGGGPRPIPDALDWLQDPDLCLRRLGRILHETTAEGLQVVYGGQVLARAGGVTPAETMDIAAFVRQNWDAHSERDLARFMHSPVKANGYFLYVTRLVGDLALAGIFAPATPLSQSRAQTRRIANAILQMTPAPRPTLDSLRDGLIKYEAVSQLDALRQAGPEMPEDDYPEDEGGLSEAEQISLNQLLSGMPSPDPLNSLDEAGPPPPPQSFEDWQEELPGSIGASPIDQILISPPAANDVPGAGLDVETPDTAEAQRVEETTAAESPPTRERQWWETDDLFGELGLPRPYDPIPPADETPQAASAAAEEPSSALQQSPVPDTNIAESESPAMEQPESAEPDFRPAPFLAEIKPAQPPPLHLAPEILRPEPEGAADELSALNLTPSSSMFSSFGDLLEQAIAGPAEPAPQAPESSSAAQQENLPPESLQAEVNAEVKWEVQAEVQPELQPPRAPEAGAIDAQAEAEPVQEPERKMPGFSVPGLDEGLPAPPQYGLYPWDQEEANPLQGDSPLAETQISGAPITQWLNAAPEVAPPPPRGAEAALSRLSDPNDTRPVAVRRPAGQPAGAQGLDRNTGQAVITRVTYTCLLIPRVEEHYLDGELADFLCQVMPRLCQAFGWALLECVVRPEYLQWTVEVTPTVSAGNLVRIARQRTSEELFRNHPNLLTLNMSGDFWAPGYLVVRGTQFPSSQLLRDFIYQTRRRQGLLRS